MLFEQDKPRPPGPTLDEPRGYNVVTFVSAVMIVVGVGLAWPGLLLAGAGFILAIIEGRELMSRNPWIMPSSDETTGPLASKQPMRITLAGTAVLVVGSVAAFVAVQASDEPLLALPPAIVTAVVSVLFNKPLRLALEAAGRDAVDK